MASLIKRGKTYYAAWRENGKQRRVSLETTQKAEAKRRLGIWERKRAEAKWSLEQVIDVAPATFWNAYLPYLKRQRARRTVEIKEYFWKRFADEFQPETLGSVTTAQVERWKANQIDSGNYSPHTINNFMKDMRAIYNAAGKVALGDAGPLYNGDNPFSGPERVPIDNVGRRVLSAEDRDRLVGVAVEHATTAYNRNEPQAREIGLVLALAAYTGMRKSEVINCQWSWLDFDSKLVRVTQDATYRTKTGRDRDIPMNQTLLRPILEPHRQETGYVYLPDKAPNPETKYRATFMRSWKYVTEKAGLEWVTPHTMRHSWFTRLIGQGVLESKAAKWGGHKTGSITVDTYTHLAQYDEDIEKL